MQDDANKPSPGEPPPGMVLEIMREGFVKGVVNRSLAHRGKTSPALRNALNAAIRSHVRLQGFRDASKAPPKRLIPAVFLEIDRRCPRLADAVVRVWEDNRQPLRKKVAEYLEQSAAEGRPEPPEDRTWTMREWTALRDRIVEQHGKLDGDEVALMLCVATGTLPSVGYDDPDEEIYSPRFVRWLDELERLPADMPEWEEAEQFAKVLSNLAAQKRDEMDNAVVHELEAQIDEVRDDYKEELRYLDIDVRTWFNEAAARQATIPEALALVLGMKKELAAYHEVRPQAPSREQERSRAAARERHEHEIIEALATWNKLMEHPVDPPASEVGDTRERYDVDAPEVRAAGDAAGNASQQEIEILREEKRKLEDRLKEEAEAASFEKEQLGDEISRLKAELAQSRKDEEYWRAQYVSKSSEDADAANGNHDAAAPAELGSVKEVIAHVERTFPKQLRFALNGKSEKNTPYQKPREVFDALAWLATEYHHLRPDPGAKADFDRLIKETVPGWSYKPNQTDTTMGMYPEWYRAVVDGKTYELANHIGKGAGFDPQNTIRIAFAWDDERQQVVVGYIGRHQRNRQS